MRVSRWWLVVSVIGGVATALVLLWLMVRLGIFSPPPLVSPLSQLSYIQVSDLRANNRNPKRVYGYLPYWTMNQATPSAAVTDIYYFSVSLQGDGSLREREGNELDMGLYRLQGESFTALWEEAQRNNQRLHVTVTVLETDTVVSLLRNPAAKQRAIETIEQLVSSYPFVGVNMDLEYAGTVDDSLRKSYSEFLRDLSIALEQQDPSLELSVALFGSAASKYTIWDIPAWHEYVDTIIVMAYDYHVRSSTTAGPVAPIFGKGTGRWQDDVVTNIRDLLKIVPSEKVVLGIPFYGYEWSTTSQEPGSFTLPKSGSTATYQRVQALLSDPEVVAQERWDADALAPYIVYSQDGQNQIIYYENSRSIAYKMDFVQQLNLAGIAVWAIGYEGPYPELWQVIGSKLRPNSGL